jgi:HEAT repeat protein
VTAMGELALDFDVVLALLHTDEPPVRRAAARALPSFGAARSLEPLLEALADDDPTVREAVSDALIGIGDVAGSVAPFLGDHRREAAALAVLVRLSNAHPGLLRSYATEEQRRALHYHRSWQALSPSHDDRVQLLVRGLRHRALRHAEHAVRALAPPGEQETIDLAITNVDVRDPNQRAAALDTLEAIAEPDLVRPLLAVWEPVPSSSAADQGMLRALLDEDDPWIRASAAFAAWTSGDAGLLGVLEGLSRDDPDPIVREAAGHVVREDGPVETVSMLSLMDRVMALQKVPLFSALSPEDLKHVAESLTENVYVDGTVIAMQDDPGDVMHVVVSGEVRVLRGDEHPEEVARRGPGYIVGEMAILAEQPRMADLVAAGEVRTLSIDRQRFQRILRERPDAALAVMRELCLRLIEAHAIRPGDAATFARRGQSGPTS